jgi:hydroxymethylpyrimidine/phosphomethylpyrimidine kinase
MRYKTLTIAGFDGSGGAGIQADLKTFAALGCYGMTVLTALPIQNTCGVRNLYEIPLQAIEDQMYAIFEDIRPDSIKIGMLFNTPIIELVADFLQRHALSIPIVVDPVTIAKSGDLLLLPEAAEAMKTLIMPLATVLTPNIPEAATFSKLLATTEEEMLTVAKAMLTFGSEYVLLKGGHLNTEESNDLLLGSNDAIHWFTSTRVKTKNTHGTGCTLSAAIAANLAKGMSVTTACQQAKEYLFHALVAAKPLKIGLGQGPVHHFYDLWQE